MELPVNPANGWVDAYEDVRGVAVLAGGGTVPAAVQGCVVLECFQLHFRNLATT